MARPATRQRQERFAETFDGVQALNWRAAVDRFLSREGMSWLTDEQMSEVISDMASHALFSQRLRLRNRALLRRAAA